MIRNIAALIKNDLAIAFKNKSVYLILFIPLFAILSLKLVDEPKDPVHRSRISDVAALHKDGLQKQSLPTWVLMSVLLVGLVIMPAQVAEEKEKKLLLGLLQTPMREGEWVLAKAFSGMLLTFAAVFLLHALGGFDLGGASSYLLFLAAGSFCFSSFGILLGCLCASQASARNLGVLFYLPLMLPAALSGFSQKFSAVAPLFPSYQFFAPVRAILLKGSGISGFPLELPYLFLLGAFACMISVRLIKIRWLM